MCLSLKRGQLYKNQHFHLYINLKKEKNNIKINRILMNGQKEEMEES